MTEGVRLAYDTLTYILRVHIFSEKLSGIAANNTDPPYEMGNMVQDPGISNPDSFSNAISFILNFTWFKTSKNHEGDQI